MPNKSDPQGGKRTKGRHITELGAGGALALLIVSYLPEAWADPFQRNLASVVLTGGFSTLAKIVHEAGMVGRLFKVGIVLGVLGTLGCAMQVGTVDPKIHTGHDGETIVACTVKGVSLAWGDASVCRNTEGGHVSEIFGGMWTSTVDTVRTIVAAVFVPFTAIGAAGQALAVAPPARFPSPPDDPPAVVFEPEVEPAPAPSVPDWFGAGS